MGLAGGTGSLRRAGLVGRLARVGWFGVVLGIAACGGGSSSNSSPSSPSGAATCGTDGKTIVISNNTVCPSTLTVTLGTQVTFVNNDARNHNMTSDPHPEH